MSGNTLNDGPFSVTFHDRFNLNDRPIICPHCGADRGLAFTAAVSDTTASARCPRGHVWDEPKLHGGDVRNLYLRYATQ